nr:MAG TPA: hypothetical protein [Caudoviricetes sp.]
MGCRDCYYWYRCLERSRDYACKDYRKKEPPVGGATRSSRK